MINENQHVGIERLYGGDVAPMDCFRATPLGFQEKLFVPWSGK